MSRGNVNRRVFLQSAAALAAGTTVTPYFVSEQIVGDDEANAWQRREQRAPYTIGT